MACICLPRSKYVTNAIHTRWLKSRFRISKRISSFPIQNSRCPARPLPPHQNRLKVLIQNRRGIESLTGGRVANLGALNLRVNCPGERLTLDRIRNMTAKSHQMLWNHWGAALAALGGPAAGGEKPTRLPAFDSATITGRA